MKILKNCHSNPFQFYFTHNGEIIASCTIYNLPKHYVYKIALQYLDELHNNGYKDSYLWHAKNERLNCGYDSKQQHAYYILYKLMWLDRCYGITHKLPVHYPPIKVY